MKKLSIEQKMQYLQKCLELGADIDIYFHNFKQEEEALQAAEALSGLTSISFESKSNERKTTNWFKFKTDDYGFGISIFYNKEGYMFEDIHWDGMEEDEHVS